MSLDSCLSKVFHDISNAASVLNFYVELIKSNAQVFSIEELDEINYNILVQLNVLKFAFQDDTSSRIVEYLTAYVTHKGKTLVIHQSEGRYMRFLVNLLITIVNMLAKGGTIDVYATEDHFSVKLLGNLEKSLTENVKSFNISNNGLPGSLYMADFLLKNNLAIMGDFIADNEFEIKLV